MDFTEIARLRQSCRNYNPDKTVESEKLDAILETARLSPSACNDQPYHITVCSGEIKNKVARATMGMGLNKFTVDAPVLIVISEKPYNRVTALGAKLKNNDYRSMDIGILSAYITAEATEQGLSSCIIGWLECDKIKEILGLDGDIRLVITLGYAADDDKLREKKRKTMEELITIK